VQRFKVVESYLHKAAKDVVVGWLRAAAEKADNGMDWFEVSPIKCRTNRGPPGYGIWPEWPITTGPTHYGIEFVWDEVWPFERATELACETVPPTPDELIANGRSLAAVIDIGVMHKGRLGCAVEIVHRHPVPAWKRTLLEKNDVQLVEVCALAVLKQIEPRSFVPLWTPKRNTPPYGLSPAEIAEDYRAFEKARMELGI
jgi:hypothetical protein